MRPALRAVTTRLRSGVLPSAGEFTALLTESNTDPTEAQALTRAYAAAVAAETPSHEKQVMAALRSFDVQLRSA